MNNRKLELSKTLMISIVCAISFGLIAVFVSNTKIKNFDNTMINLIQGLESPQLTTIMKLFTMIGNGFSIAIITFVVMFILYIFLGHRTELVFLVCVVIGSSLLNTLLKLIFKRARPDINRIAEAHGYSFPSGHSMAAFTLYGVIAFLLWKHVPTAVGRVTIIILSSLFITLIGVSRIYLGVHYPSDILGGYLMSACWLTGSIWIYQRYLERSKRIRSTHE
ncbi:phosphatase PAP2 family protein [Paenibacillus antarcticus]|uniref:Phospholipid phosphatase n=1 Tax=Paenibacillus antarcticus TaxID=253703 RepID=A0A168LUG8_9BACL|nr:phosphatase PAP2 family protein [Paenibacillus antarcticus]OAB43851.1 phospholipid phosphatase [Paenibacillus antarcticus]